MLRGNLGTASMTPDSVNSKPVRRFRAALQSETRPYNGLPVSFSDSCEPFVSSSNQKNVSWTPLSQWRTVKWHDMTTWWVASVVLPCARASAVRRLHAFLTHSGVRRRRQTFWAAAPAVVLRRPTPLLHRPYAHCLPKPQSQRVRVVGSGPLRGLLGGIRHRTWYTRRASAPLPLARLTKATQKQWPLLLMRSP